MVRKLLATCPCDGIFFWSLWGWIDGALLEILSGWMEFLVAVVELL